MRTALFQGLLALDLHSSGLIGDSRDKLVVNEDNRVVLDTALCNEVSDASGVSKGGDVASNLVESQVQVLAQCADQLGF